MKWIAALIALLMVLLGASPCFAASYLLGYPSFDQEIVLKHIVDEFVHLYIAERGLAVEAGDGSWCYGKYDANHNLIPTSYRVGEEEGNETMLDELRHENAEKNRNWAHAIRSTAPVTLLKGVVGKIASNPASLVVLLVCFSDTLGTYNYRIYYTDMFFSTNTYTGYSPIPHPYPLFGSIKDYYYDISNGSFNLTGYVANPDTADGKIKIQDKISG